MTYNFNVIMTIINAVLFLFFFGGTLLWAKRNQKKQCLSNK